MEKLLVELLEGIWDGIDWDAFPDSIRKRIYGFFIDRVKSAAYAPNLRKFIEKLCKYMHSDLPSKIPDELLKSENDEPYLHLLREQTRVLIYQLRDNKERRKNERTANSQSERKD
jgi:hypothetical protein